MLEHKHLLVKASSPISIVNTSWIEGWIEELVEAIDMKILMGPFAIYSEVEGNTGITAGAILSTSHTVIHTFERPDGGCEIHLDIYSCAPIDLEKVWIKLRELTVDNVSYKFLDRDKDFTVISRSNHV